MQNNRIAQIVYRTIYITLGFIGIIGSFGYFNRNFNQNFYLMYTNLSNYFCIGITLYLLIGNIKNRFQLENADCILPNCLKEDLC